MRKPRLPQKIGRKRRLTGWTLITLGVVAAAVWVASGWWSIVWHRPDGTRFVMGGGALTRDPSGRADAVRSIHGGWGFGTFDPSVPVIWYGLGDQVGEFYLSHSFGVFRITPLLDVFQGTSWGVLFWPIPLLLWFTAAPILRSGIIARRRATTNTCITCGYSRAGLAAASPCPECGGKISGDNQRREPH